MATREESPWKKIVCFAGIAALCAMAAVAPAAAWVSGDIEHMFNAEWMFDVDGTNKHLTYDMDTNSFDKFTGSFCNQATGLALGVNVDTNMDNNAVSQADRFMGYLGYKDIYLRYQRGKLSGAYSWDGAVTPTMSREGTFEQTLTHVDMLFWSRIIGAPGYWGIGYTSMAFPVEVDTLYTYSDKAGQHNGTAVYDPDYKATFYSILFGFDTFAGGLASTANPITGKGFGVYLSGEDRLGFGESRLGKMAVENAKALNPGLKPVTESFFAAIIENDTSIGLRWFSPNGKVRIGVGYEVSFIANFNFNGAAVKPGDLGFDTYASLFRYGPVARLQLEW